VKARASGEGFATLERWLGDADAQFLRRDRPDPLVVLPWSIWAQQVPGMVRPSRRGQERDECTRSSTRSATLPQRDLLS
jgi:hypothetical protein